MSDLQIIKKKKERRNKMSKFRILLAAVLCISLLTFAGCGSNDTTDGNEGDGTVTEENRDMENGSGDDMGTEDGTHKDGSVAEDLKDDAKDAVDDIENAVDGNNKDNNTKETTVGQ